jgi:hypothetical protein
MSDFIIVTIGTSLGCIGVSLAIVFLCLYRLFGLLEKAIHTEVNFVSAKQMGVANVAITEERLKEVADVETTR